VVPIVWLDAIHYKIKENGHYTCKAIYTILGLNIEGKKELLGLYLSDQEGAHHWLSVLTDLQNRGIKDILIACVDGLKGFPEAIESIYPDRDSAALKHNAAAVILAHNHPSGVPEPSCADKSISQHLKQALKLIDIRVLDHIVVGGLETLSFAELGLI
jgi:proteasome lid subunit RPN8/RPN11